MGITGKPVFPCLVEFGHARRSAPQPDPVAARHTLTVRHVEALLAQEVVHRSHLHVLRLCQNGMPDAVKVPGPSGDEWYVAPVSVPKAIGDLKQIDAQRAARHSGAQHAVSGHGATGLTGEIERDAARHSAPRQATSEKENMIEKGETSLDMPGHDHASASVSGYVTQLTKRLEDKDEMIGMLKGQLISKDQQITDISKSNANLSERFADTQKLLGAMQRMFAPLVVLCHKHLSPPNRRHLKETLRDGAIEPRIKSMSEHGTGLQQFADFPSFQFNHTALSSQRNMGFGSQDQA